MKNEYSVDVVIKNKVAWLTFGTPDHNALPSSALSEIERAFLALSENKDVLVIVLKSAGDRTFCAGASFKELIAIEDETTGKAFFMGFAKVILAMRKCPQLIIGRVQGKTVGGGVGLAAATDYCLATKFASVKLSEISIGIGPFVIGPAVQRKIGVSAFSQLSIDATEFYGADWAHQKGLYTEVFVDAEAMDAAVTTLAERLATYNPEALIALKKMYWEGTENWPEVLEKRAEQSGTMVLSSFTKEVLAKYK